MDIDECSITKNGYNIIVISSKTNGCGAFVKEPVSWCYFMF